MIGQDRQAATDELEARASRSSPSDFESCDEPNTVSETDPPAGSDADEGSEVEIIVSLGLEVAIPTRGVIDEPAADATKKLHDENLQVRSEEVNSNDVKARERRRHRAGDGREGRVRVGRDDPDLEGRGARDRARTWSGCRRMRPRRQLRDAGFVSNVETEDSDLPEGQVIAQDPGGGSEVKKGLRGRRSPSRTATARS